MKPTLIPDRRAAERYGVHIRTLARWDAAPNLGFPAPIYEALDQWDRENSRQAASLRAQVAQHQRETATT
jgi:hypothetical protein